MSRPSPSSTPSGWQIVLWLVGFAALGHLNRVGIAVAGSEIFIPAYGIAETQMGWVYTAFLITYTIGMLPGGWLIDRIGAVRTMVLFGLTMGLFVACTGSLAWLTSGPQGLWMGLLFVRSLAGFCSVPLHPAAAHIIAEFVTPRFRTTANGFVTAGALFGIACSYPIYGWMIDRCGWPSAFILGGCVLFAFAWLWRWRTRTMHAVHERVAGQIEHQTTHPWPILRQRNLWLVSLSYSAYGYFQYLFFYWMGYYFKEILHVPEVEARWTTFWILLAQGAGMALGGMSTDSICRMLGPAGGRRFVVMTGMGLGALFGLLAVNLTEQRDVAMALAISMAALGLCEGVFWTTATEISVQGKGFSAAFMNTGGNLGGLVSPVLTPFLAQSLGWPGAITVACGVAALGGVVWLLIKPTPIYDNKNSTTQAGSMRYSGGT